MNLKRLFLLLSLVGLLMFIAACGGSDQPDPVAEEETTSEETVAEETEEEEMAEEEAAEEEMEEEEAEESDASADGGSLAQGAGDCPLVTLTDRQGVPPGQYGRIYELDEYQDLAGCTLGFNENPDIVELNGQITGNPDLLPLVERLPVEPLVVVPYQSVGTYGGQLDALSNATEAGTSDFLSVRHVNLVRYGDDYVTIEPNVAKSWAWNADFTELTVELREGHKWSDGAPFTANDVAFWLNELILNTDVYPDTPGFVSFGDSTMTIDVIDDTTFRFNFPVPTPGILSFFATTYIQPWQPQHFFEAKIEEGFSLAEVADLWYGGSDWTDTPSPLLSGEADDVLPTLESHILVEESTEGRHLVANPYFHMIDTVGNQLPYISEHDELYVPEKEVRNLKITNGEVDYKVQAIFIDDFPLYKENEANGNYTVDLGNGVGETMFYGFNLNHPDEGLREIFLDLRFRQAMSLAMDRAEIVELVYLGQAEPIQATPADPNTVNFVTDAHKTAFIEYDVDAANALLDEMGLVDADGDGFRDRLDGSDFVIDLQFSNQGGPVRIHELTKSYWEAVGVRTELKEVTSDEYRAQGAANELEVLTWKYDGTAGSTIVLNTEQLLPPFGEFFNPGIANLWADWVATDGAEGVEPPADVLELYEITAEFLQKPLGTPESDALGEQIVDIHVDNLFKIGIAGNVKAPIIRHNTLANFGAYNVVSYDYYRAYPLIPAQWYFNEDGAESTEETFSDSVGAVAPTIIDSASDSGSDSEEAAEETASADQGAGDCPVVTIADRAGVAEGTYVRQYELAEYQDLAGCTLGFNENPDIASLNAQIVGNPELPSVADRLPAEPLVVVPYDTIGQYGGQLDALSNATEAGTSDFLSVRHVNLVRYGDDYVTIEPNVAKGWSWNDDFTELTVELREGHKWSDGAPFTANDVAFWLNELILNPEVYPDTPGFVSFGDSTMTIDVIDDTTFRFNFPVPTPGILSFFATTYIQPWQPQHFFEAKIEEGFSLAEVADLWYGGSDWTDTPSPLLSGEADDVLPTLESHILVEESTEGRHLVANPYFHMVDTVGNQLPYISEHDELYVPEKEVRNLKITNGEVDYKVQAIFIDDFPLYKENEANGNYTVDLGNGVGETMFYGFNLNHPDEGLREIFLDLRFRQAMSLAMNRAEIVELIYLGQAEPIQATPADPNTVNFVTDAHKTAFIEYDVDGANALLDEMGLVDADGDGFRDRLDGSDFVLDLQFSNQGGPVRIHELTKSYWEAVGVRTELKEVTSDEYRAQGAANELEVLTWKYDGTAGSTIVLNTEQLLPPFGEFFNPGIANLWADWVATDGAEGVEPPTDVLELYEITAEFLQQPLGTPESDALGEQIVDIHVNNLFKIGIAGNVKAPIIVHNTLQNFGPYDVVSYDYYRSYPMIPAQWWFSE